LDWIAQQLFGYFYHLVARLFYGMYRHLMSGWKRVLLWGAVLTVLVFTLAYAALHFVVSSGRFQQWLTAELSKKSGY
jgi:hypothetical protein